MNPPDFLLIPYEIIIDSSLQPTDRILYGVIYWLVKLKDGHCYASNATLSDMCKVTPRAIRAGLERLESRGYIKRDLSLLKNGRLTRDEIVPLISFQRMSYPQGVGTDVPEGVGTNVPQNNKSPKKNIYTNKNLEKVDKYLKLRSQHLRIKNI